MTMAETHPDRTTGTLPVEPPGQSILRRRPLPVPGNRRGPGNRGRSKSIVVFGAGDPLARRVTRALLASGHDVTVAVSGDDVHESSGASRRVIRWETPMRCDGPL